MTLAHLAPRARPVLETLEDRIALAWSGVPPATISTAGALGVTLNTAASAAGNAAITNSEVDLYTFVAPRSGSYTLNVSTPSSNLDPVLGVFNASGQRLAYNDDIATGDTDSRLSLTLTAGQRYYFGVSNYTGSPQGAYSWGLTGPAGLTDDRYEDNDSLAQARNLGTLTARSQFTGLVMADTADWFRFTMNGGGNANSYVAINFTHSRGDLDLRLYDSAGTMVRMSDGSTDSERISLNGLAQGTYYVQVYGYRGVTNPSYSLDVTPGVGSGGGGGSAARTLYLNFDGYNISRTELVRYAGTNWASTVNDFDADRNGINVGRFLANRGDREQIITRMIQLVQADLTPFGITVRRHTGGAVEGQGATTIFLGPSTLSNGFYHVACEVDIGNNNRTDIAFVGNEDWGTAERTALAMADVTLHEAGHTWGLWHVQSGNDSESMGLRYSVNDQSQWVRNTGFLNRTYAAFNDGGGAHGPGPQNSFQKMTQTFGSASNPTTGTASASNLALTNTSRAGVFQITTNSPNVDTVTLRRLNSGAIEVMINGQAYELARGYTEVRVFTSGDRRDQVVALNDLGSLQVSVNRSVGAELQTASKSDTQTRNFWAGRDLGIHGTGCGCSVCQGGVRMTRESEMTVETTPVVSAPVETATVFVPVSSTTVAVVENQTPTREEVTDQVMMQVNVPGRPRVRLSWMMDEDV